MQMVKRTYRETDIAVIGLAGRFPGARDIQQFWQLLLAGYDGIEYGVNPDADHVNAVGRMPELRHPSRTAMCLVDFAVIFR